MSDLHIGCDNGQRGGLAALSAVKGVCPISVLPMPMKRVDGVPQMDIRAVVEWVHSIYPTGNCHVWVEKCPKHAMSQAAMRSQAINYGKMLAIFEARFPHMVVHRVRCGRDLEGWQRAFYGSFTAEDSKDKSVSLARALWPEMVWPEKKGVPVDGVTDACHIAEFGRRKLAGEPMPTESLT